MLLLGFLVFFSRVDPGLKLRHGTTLQSMDCQFWQNDNPEILRRGRAVPIGGKEERGMSEEITACGPTSHPVTAIFGLLGCVIGTSS